VCCRPIAHRHDQVAARLHELLSSVLSDAGRGERQAVSISVTIVPPQVRQRPGRRGGMNTLVERPHEKQYTRNSLGLARAGGGAATGVGSSTPSRLTITAETLH
jgi:hypothetical protein